MKKIMLSCMVLGLNTFAMDNPYNKKRQDEKMSIGLYGLKYGFDALLERENMNPIETSSIIITKNHKGVTEVSCDNFMIFRSSTEVTISPKLRYSHIHNIKGPLRFPHNHPLFDKTDKIISSARKGSSIGGLQYYNVSSDLIRDIEKFITN